jgi:metal-sulfur cluster biosynthetic enzyme
MTNEPSKALSSARLMEALTPVVDPDLGIGIIDLGLIYDIRVSDGRVEVDMTFTSMGCPAGPYIYDEVKRILNGVDGVKEVEMNIVWEPPWSPDRVNPEVRFALGLY